MQEVFKDKNGKKRDSVTDLIYRIVDLLLREIAKAQSAAA